MARSSQHQRSTRQMDCVVCEQPIETGQRRKPTENGPAHEGCLRCQVCGRETTKIVAAELIHESLFSAGEKKEENVSMCPDHYWESVEPTLDALREAGLGKAQVFNERVIDV